MRRPPLILGQHDVQMRAEPPTGTIPDDVVGHREHLDPIPVEHCKPQPGESEGSL